MAMRLLGCLVSLAILPLNGMAAITNADLEEFELGLWRVRSDFHMLTIMTGGQTYAADLESSIDKARRTLKRIESDAEGSEERKLAVELNSEWKNFEKAASSNTMAEQGYTDTYTIQDVNEIPALMLEKMDGFKSGIPGNYDDVHELAAFLQRMTSEYLNLAADPSGGMAAGTDEGRLEFKDAVPRFESMLASAKKKHSGDEAMSRALAQVGLKWTFIRESMVKFYENAVPFLVYRYTKQMVDTLDQAVNLASTEVEKPTFGPVE
ncbi:MAG: hypothetical protein ACPH3N_09580 [Alcanivorax sediminis]|uniref:Uncharacterized protein n=1 Tax=Alcanivorax sediminis TaxID=2663008 RepID=A0A6N7M1A1_9GAMM|nr:hypothetical protein [Alcanivorax sediminis]MQX54040.1 hypothetical protein [Alcanivorax sediminis]